MPKQKDKGKRAQKRRIDEKLRLPRGERGGDSLAQIEAREKRELEAAAPSAEELELQVSIFGGTDAAALQDLGFGDEHHEGAASDASSEDEGVGGAWPAALASVGMDADEDKDEDEDEDDAAEDDDDDNAADDDAEEEDDGSDASTALLGSKEKGGEKERTKKVKHNVHHSDDDDDDDDEYYSKDDVPVENDDDIEEERDSEHTSSGHRHHHHSSVKLGESGRDEVQAKDLDDIVFNTFDSAT